MSLVLENNIPVIKNLSGREEERHKNVNIWKISSTPDCKIFQYETYLLSSHVHSYLLPFVFQRIHEGYVFTPVCPSTGRDVTGPARGIPQDRGTPQLGQGYPPDRRASACHADTSCGRAEGLSCCLLCLSLSFTIRVVIVCIWNSCSCCLLFCDKSNRMRTLVLLLLLLLSIVAVTFVHYESVDEDCEEENIQGLSEFSFLKFQKMQNNISMSYINEYQWIISAVLIMVL